jgi:23S rRNA (guanosine2251-2'-O)-methyltransferase
MVLVRDRATGVTAAAAKASAGAVEHVGIAVVTNLAGALLRLREAGFWCVGLDAAAGLRYDRFDYTSPVALVVGAEGEGLRPLTRRRCDALVSLPMLGRVASLNAAAAGAILLYEAARQRDFGAR